MTIALQPGLERSLKASVEGEVMCDAFARGRYATDASIYQMMPLGVVVPQSLNDVRAAIAVAREEGVPVLPRGGGTSQCGQTVNEALVIDTSKHLNRLLKLDVVGRTCVVEPGMVLDELNRLLRPHGLWLPGRCVHLVAGDNRRHGGQQFLWRPFHPLWPDAGKRDRHRRPAGRRHRGAVRQTCHPISPGSTRRSGTSSPGCWRWVRVRPKKSPRGSPRCCAGWVVTTSMRLFPMARRTTWRICWSARKAPWPIRRRLN